MKCHGDLKNRFKLNDCESLCLTFSAVYHKSKRENDHSVITLSISSQFLLPFLFMRKVVSFHLHFSCKNFCIPVVLPCGLLVFISYNCFNSGPFCFIASYDWWEQLGTNFSAAGNEMDGNFTYNSRETSSQSMLFDTWTSISYCTAVKYTCSSWVSPRKSYSPISLILLAIRHETMPQVVTSFNFTLENCQCI